MKKLCVLFCVGISAAVSITIGVILCVYGIVNLVVIGVSRRPLIGVMGVTDGVIVAVGVAFCTHNLSTVIVLMIPFVMEIVGALMVIDAFWNFFFLKQGGIPRLVVVCLSGGTMTALGLSFLILEDFRLGYSQLVVGILLCIGATLLTTFATLGLVKKRSIKD